MLNLTDKGEQMSSELDNKSKLDAPENKMGVGLALGAGIGTAFGIIFDNLGVGLSLGVGLGIAVGSLIGQWQRKTEEQE